MEVIIYSCATWTQTRSVYHIKTEDFYKDIAGDVETRFDTSGYSEERPLPIGLNKKNDQSDEGCVGWEDHDRVCDS